MTEITYQSFAQQLRTMVPGFERVYDEHLNDYDEILPHVLLADLVRFLSTEVEAHGGESAALKPAMTLLEQGMASADPELQELVAVSFIENLERSDAAFPVIKNLFGPKLEEQLARYEGDTSR